MFLKYKVTGEQSFLVPYMEPTVIFRKQFKHLLGGLTKQHVRAHTDLFDPFPQDTKLSTLLDRLNKEYLFLEAMEKFLKTFPDLRMKCHGIHLFSGGFVVSIVGHEQSRTVFNSMSAMHEWLINDDDNELSSYDGRYRINCPFYTILIFSDKEKAKPFLYPYGKDMNEVEELAGTYVPVQVIRDIVKPDMSIIPAGSFHAMKIGEPCGSGFDHVLIEDYELADIEVVMRSIRLA